MKKSFKKDLLNFSKTFSFEDNLILPTIYGEEDKFLDQIENNLNVKIITRGNIIKIEGLEENVNLAKKLLNNLYNLATIEYSEKNLNQTIETLKLIINKKHPTYSALSLYFIIDNDLVSDKKVVFNLFEIIINDTSLDKEIKNLVIYKKALFYAAEIDDNENELLDILSPLINSESVWKSHALYLMGEYYFSKNQKQKAKEFYKKIIASENTNPDIKKEVQKRLNRDFSE